MASVASPPEVYSAEEMRELSDTELNSIVEEGGKSEQATLARTVLEERAEAFGSKQSEELKGEAGEPVGKMPAKEAGSSQPEVDEIVLQGSSQLELFDMGGKKATRATIKFSGGKVKIEAGQGFKKGHRIRFSGEAIVNEVGQKDEHDPQTGQVVDCEQRHGARIVDLSVERAG